MRQSFIGRHPAITVENLVCAFIKCLSSDAGFVIGPLFAQNTLKCEKTRSASTAKYLGLAAPVSLRMTWHRL